PKHGRGKLTTVTYQVADLVVPIPNMGGKDAPTTDAKPATQEDRLIALIRSTVDPKSWAEAGGPGTVGHFPLTMTPVVNQTADVQEQVAELLGALRRLQEQQVVLEVRFLTVSDETLESACKGLQKQKLDPAPACGDAAQPTWTAFLSEAQVRCLLEQLQGDA